MAVGAAADDAAEFPAQFRQLIEPAAAGVKRVVKLKAVHPGTRHFAYQGGLLLVPSWKVLTDMRQ